eukprot:11790766-Heterocapsa_arctica.AAC.1
MVDTELRDREVLSLLEKTDLTYASCGSVKENTSEETLGGGTGTEDRGSISSTGLLARAKWGEALSNPVGKAGGEIKL